MAYDDKSGGALFIPQNRRSDKSPDFSGNITLSMDDLKKIIGLVKKGEDYEIRVSGWKNKSKKGTPYVGLAINVQSETERKEYENSRTGGGGEDFSLGDAGGFDPDLDDEIPFD